MNTKLWALLLAVAVLPWLPSTAQVAGLNGADESLELIDLILETVGASRVDCDDSVPELGPAGSEALTICAAYSAGFSSFKSDLGFLLRRHQVPAALSPLEPWRLDGRAYGRSWQLEECRIGFHLDERLSRITIQVSRYVEPESDVADELPALDP